ncbi:Ubiquinone/menaquinone biosynthesis C-methylase UbiE [Ruminococcaceae bacterium YRB3002]|nr:Ubiquinone/menaquinone biosynthesis C-methylase UbiE [Ruminococcaceae bacterium YRB3002]
MFWSRISGIYDFVENTYNGKANARTTGYVASLMEAGDEVLECACGTGMFSVKIAPRVRRLVATDFADGMLDRTRKKCRDMHNVFVEKGDITDLQFEDGQFDKAVAANVIHLLDDPKKAIDELRRVVRPGGMIIIPTYIHIGKSVAAGMFNKAGANFKRHFDEESYREFFEEMGIKDVEFHVCEGRMACDVAVFENRM